MPQPALHVLLAIDTLDRWSESHASLGFDPCSPRIRNAAMHGALGPDIGYFPGADSRLSALAHTRSSGALARAMLERAESAEQAAFAWGWVTHIIGDVELHPLINATAADVPDEVLRVPVAERSVAGHTRVEIGLDVWTVATGEPMRDDLAPRRAILPKLCDAFDQRAVEFIAAAYEATYGIVIDRRRLFADHLRVTRFYNLYRILVGLLAASGDILSQMGVATLRGITLGLSRACPAWCYIRPLEPSLRFRAAAYTAFRRCRATLDRHMNSSLLWLPDYDLEHGGFERTALPSRDVGVRQPYRAPAVLDACEA